MSQKQPHRSSEILPSLLGCHKEFLGAMMMMMMMMRRRRPLRFKAKFEMADDPVDKLWIFNEREDRHPAAT